MANEVLRELYGKITVLETIEKLRNCGLVWNQISVNQYKSTVQQGTDVWDLHLTKMPSKTVIDFLKNSQFVITISSEEDANVASLFDEIEVDQDYEKDKELLRDIQALEGC